MSKYLLKKILNLSELPQGIVFSDEYPVCCRNLVWCLLKSHLDAGREVHYFCFSIKPEKIQKYFSSERRCNADYLVKKEKADTQY
ncbi:hypothetical protein Avbf_05745 [Armadillidium vulgare]|nr:hypothetical protein Avbf_05745 [Armadillidium vulgare]